MIKQSMLVEAVLERKGCPIHYWEGGVEGAPLVVFTHGVCVDHRSWDPILPAVMDKYRVLSWDVRGHGLSQPMGEPFSLPLAVEDLLAIMDRLGYPKAVMVGHSNGTYISQELVFRHPERVTAMVVVDGTCITWEHRSAFEIWLVRNSWKMMSWMPYETLKKSSLPFSSSKKEVQDYQYDAFSMLNKAEFIALFKGAALGLHAEPEYRIPVPMLLVHGENDKMGDIVKIASHWASREPNCEYKIIPNAGHFAILDNPEYFTRLLLEYLDKVAPAG